MEEKLLTQGPKGAHLSSGLLLGLRNTLLKSILQLYKPTRRHSISAFFFLLVLKKLTLPLHLYILEKKLCTALDFIHLIFYLKKVTYGYLVPDTCA